MCRTHEIVGYFADDAWTSPTRTPPLYPDAVTLEPDVSVELLLARVDASRGCSIKDSYCSLELTPHGFEVLFEAQWIARSARPAVADGPPWEVVQDRATFVAWERAWRGPDDPPDLLRPALLDAASVTIVACLSRDEVIAGAVLSGHGSVVGISNFFATSGTTAAESWAGCVALATEQLPAATLVGYEVGASTDAALAQGFEAVGPLRVWRRAG